VNNNFNYEKNTRILIVDDEQLIRKMLQKYLSESKYIVDTAENGTSAIDKLQNENYDLVLTDLKMPTMGGAELLKVMSKKFPNIPKIVLTGYGTNDDIILALKTEAYDFLTKPIVDLTILGHSVKRALEKKRLSDEKNRYFEQIKQINNIVSMLNSGKNTDEIFSTLNKILRQNIPFDNLTLKLIQKNNNKLITKLSASNAETIHKDISIFDLDKDILREMLGKNEVVNIKDVNKYLIENDEFIFKNYLYEDDMNSYLILPLLENNETNGFLVFSSKNFSAFKEDHIIFLESLGGQIFLSIRRGELVDEIEEHSKNLEKLVEMRSRQIIKTQKTTIFALSKLAEARDSEIGYHLERIQNYSVLLAQILKYLGNYYQITNEFLRNLYDASILHDIGKVGIPDGILLKEGFLSPAEYEIMKTHTTIGYDALKEASNNLGGDTSFNMALDIIRYHHERWDGKGYPVQLKGEEIPLSARIVSIVDIYDALTTKRPYKDAFSHEKSLQIMKEEIYRFDPKIAKIFIENAEEFEIINKQFTEKLTGL